MKEKELTFEEFSRTMMLHDAEVHFNGSIVALEALRKTFMECEDESVTVKELVEDLIPGFIRVVHEDYENSVKEIMSMSSVEDKPVLN